MIRSIITTTHICTHTHTHILMLLLSFVDTRFLDLEDQLCSKCSTWLQAILFLLLWWTRSILCDELRNDCLGEGARTATFWVNLDGLWSL